MSAERLDLDALFAELDRVDAERAAILDDINAKVAAFESETRRIREEAQAIKTVLILRTPDAHA